VSEFEISQDRFKSDLGEFLRAIQTVRVVDLAAFQRVDREAAELAKGLKGQALVPRSLLNELRVATKILRAEVPYVEGGRNDLASMADKLEMTFDLILKGESPEDRVPGVPRII
jgi:hypothetical protein